jgi:hypothetical protein
MVGAGAGLGAEQGPGQHAALAAVLLDTSASRRAIHQEIPQLPSCFPLILHLIYAWVASLSPNMRSISLLSSCLAALSSFATAELNSSQQLLSKQLLPSTFKPPQVFKNANLVRTTNLDKAYPRETINVVIENIDSKPQSEYYLPFESSLISRVGGFEVRDKKAADKAAFDVEVVGYDTERLVLLVMVQCYKG